MKAKKSWIVLDLSGISARNTIVDAWDHISWWGKMSVLPSIFGITAKKISLNDNE
jgi:hypothetical protein